MKKIGIIGAMEVEVQTLASSMTGADGTGVAKSIKSAHLSFYDGMLSGIRAVVVKSGVGKVNAALCAARLISEFGVTHIVNTGIAGAAASSLGVFDVVVSTDAMYHDVDATLFGYKPCEIPQMDAYCFPADKNLISAAEKAFAKTDAAKKYRLLKGRVASGDQFIANGEKKRRIKELCDPACIEMEGAAIAHTCYLSDVPFVIIRAMSDAADDNGGEAIAFNEKAAAEESAAIVIEMMKLL